MEDRMLCNEVAEILMSMIEIGVDGDSTMSNAQYTINFTLIDKTKPKHYRDPLWLENNYVVQERTMQEIATEFGITPAAVNQWLVKHDIPTRPRGQKRDA